MGDQEKMQMCMKKMMMGGGDKPGSGSGSGSGMDKEKKDMMKMCHDMTGGDEKKMKVCMMKHKDAVMQCQRRVGDDEEMMEMCIMKLMNMKDGGKGSGSGSGSGGRGDMKKEMSMMCKKMAENDKLYMQCMKKMNALAMGCKRRVGDDMEMIKECMMKAMRKEGEGKEGEGEGKEPEEVEDTCRTQKKNKMKKCYEEMCAKDAFMKSNKAACDKMAGRRRMEGETKMKCVGEIKMMDERCGKKENEDDCLKEGKSPFSDGICDWVEVEDKQEGGKFDQMINDAVKDLPEDQQKMVKMAAMECMKKFQEEAELKKRVGDDMEMIKECMMKAMKKDGE